MSDKRDSNPRPSAWEANALPTELLSQIGYKFIAFSQHSTLYPDFLFNG